jgi:hypothetical protein
MLGGVMGMVGQGLAFGTGSAVAHRAVDAVMGPRTVQHEHMNIPPQMPPQQQEVAVSALSAPPSVADACGNYMKSFQECINVNGTDISKCQFYLDMLTDCKKNAVAAL